MRNIVKNSDLLVVDVWRLTDDHLYHKDTKGPMKNWQRSKSEQLLGIKYAPDFGKILIEMAESMLKTGAIQQAKL